MPPFEPISISTSRLTLRFLREADLPSAYDIFSNPQVMRYWAYLAWTDPAQADHRLIRIQQGYLTSDALQLGIERNTEQFLLGTCMLFQFHAASRRSIMPFTPWI